MRIFLWFVNFVSSFFAYQYELSVCAIFQNEAPYLKEWIEYHQSVGVEHFYLYNNESTDDYRAVLESFIKSGTVELIQWPSKDKAPLNPAAYFPYDVQTPAYSDAIRRAKRKSHWLAIIDTDEFIIPVQEKSVTECLNKRFSGVSGVCVNWQNYGTSQIEKLDPTKSMLEQLVWKLRWNHPRNAFVKSIVQPEHVKKANSPHICGYLSNHGHLDTHCQKVDDDRSHSIPIDILRINHYWSRDKEYFLNNKIPRYEKWNGTATGLIEAEKEYNHEYDPIILNTEYFRG